MFRLTSKHTLLPVVLAMVAALPAHADETLTQNTVYTGAKYVRGNYDGAGHSVTVNASTTDGQAKLELNNATAKNIASLTLEGSTGLLNVQNTSSLTVTGAITSNVGVYVRGTSALSAGSIKGAVVEALKPDSKLTVSGLLQADSFVNHGTSSVGSLTTTRLNNAAGATLTVKGALTLNEGGSFVNNGTLYLSQGKFEFADTDLTSAGTLKKSETENLDVFTVKSFRNKSGFAAGKISVGDYLYNADQNTTATLEAQSISVGTSLINYAGGTLTADSVTTGGALINRGTATIGNLSSTSASSGLKNEAGAALSVTGMIASMGRYASNSGTLTLGENASFGEDAAGELSNTGTLYVQSGKLEAAALQLKNNAGATLAKSADQAKLDAVSVAWLRNEADLSVGALTTQGYIFNGEAGGRPTLTADSVSAGTSIRNDKGGKLKAGTVAAAGYMNADGAVTNAATLNVSGTVNNTEGSAMTVTGSLSAEWIDNAASTLNAEDVSVWRLLNEDGAQLTVEHLSMRAGSEGETPWLQLHSDKESTIGTLTGRNVRTSVHADSGVTRIGLLTEGSDINVIPEDLTAGKVAIADNRGSVAVSIAADIVDSSFEADDLVGSMQRAADVVSIQAGDRTREVTAKASTILGELHAVTDAAGTVVGVSEAPNAFNVGISEMASVAVMAWRAENNDLFKRLGDVRRGDEGNGVWARVMGGRSEYGTQGLRNRYTTLQTGYDHRLGSQNQFILGGAFTYTDGESTFDNGSGDNYQYGFALYGSWLGQGGEYLDVIGKYSRLKNEYRADGGVGSGSYYNNGLSLSVEAGKRFDVASFVYVEPQVEFTYGHLTAVDYGTSAQALIEQDGIDTVTGRLGVSIGRCFERGSVHLTTSYLYDWDGRTHVRMSYSGMPRTYEQDLGGHWWEISLGGSYELVDNLNVYGTFERTEGGEVDDPWQWNVGLRYAW